MSQAAEFFSDMGGGTYDASVLRAIPPYADMLNALVGSIYFERQQPLSILELGCGTGNVSQHLAHIFPNAQLTMVDLSAEMLATASQKLSKHSPAVIVKQEGFMNLDYPAACFDVVISSLALHHLLAPDKQTLYGRIFQWLKPGGLFRCADQCLGLPEAHIMARYWRRWELMAQGQEATAEEIAGWRHHCDTSDHYDSLRNHFTWLEAAGFSDVDAYWRVIFWTVFGAGKPV